jgi:hypothetical protein
MSQWQRISTAPKDGKNILIYDGFISVGYWLDGAHSWNDGNWWVEGGQITVDPTHWMPLPAAPTKEDV